MCKALRTKSRAMLLMSLSRPPWGETQNVKAILTVGTIGVECFWSSVGQKKPVFLGFLSKELERHLRSGNDRAA